MKNSITPAALTAAARGDLANFFVASTPGGIEAQERRGQAEVVRCESLPIKRQNCTEQNLVDIGIVLGKNIDDLFREATLPTGWAKKATDSSYWTHVLDEKKRPRIAIFYKAAFYDRSAFMNLETRFNYSTYMTVDKNGTATMDQKAAVGWASIVTDGGVEIFRAGVRPFCNADRTKEESLRVEHKKLIEKWFADNRPDWRDPMKYWND